MARVFELREELKEFLIVQKQHELGSNLKDSALICRLSYLVDIFDQLNRLNPKLQGKETTIIDFIDAFECLCAKT